jgi:tRNA(Ile)-lysidine synthase
MPGCEEGAARALNQRGGRRDNLVERMVQACRADPLLQAGGGRAVVGYSGGPDSTAMLHGLWRASKRLRLDMHAVHVDHRLRAESGLDAQAAAAFCAELGVPLRVVAARPRARSEEAARAVRHAALEKVASELGAETIVLGHTADDQVETVLLHLLRGSGLEGIAAMSPREGRRFRPLLAVWREQVEAYCTRHGLRPIRDASNDDPGFTRNRVRHELIPLLEDRFNPRAREAVLRLAGAARDEHDAVVAFAATWLEGRLGALPREQFNALPVAVRVEVLRATWARAAGLARPPGDAARLAQATRLIGGSAHGMIQLGSGFELLVRGHQFEIRRQPGTLRGP